MMPSFHSYLLSRTNRPVIRQQQKIEENKKVSFLTQLRYNEMNYHQSEHEGAENGREKAAPVITDGEVNGCHFNAEQHTYQHPPAKMEWKRQANTKQKNGCVSNEPETEC